MPGRVSGRLSGGLPGPRIAPGQDRPWTPQGENNMPTMSNFKIGIRLAAAFAIVL